MDVLMEVLLIIALVPWVACLSVYLYWKATS
jgi:hypothetical protein